MRAFSLWRSYDPRVTHSGITAVDWTAIGTLALAGATVAAIIVAQVQARKDRQRGDAERLAEIKRDDRLRREAAEERDRREADERRAREDYEARQVIVMVKDDPATPDAGGYLSRWVTVSTPLEYPIKWVDGTWVRIDNGNIGTAGYGFGLDNSTVDGSRAYYTFRARISSGAREVEPIIKFVDWHGNLYYQYRRYTERFPQNTDFTQAAVKIDKWIRTGPKSD